MTPQERQLVTELFDRLAGLEGAERDPDAERTIEEGLRRAPNAVYALVQTALVQDEALRRANSRIQDLEAQVQSRAGETGRSSLPTSFLGSARDALSGNRETPRGSVPTIRPQPAQSDMDAPPTYAAAPPYGAVPGMAGPSGGSFLGTAAAAAAGMIGGSLLLNGIRGMMGHHHGVGGFPASAPPLGGPSASVPPANASGTPWGDSTQHGGDLAQQAGLDDIGRSGRDQGNAAQSQGLFDSGQADDDMQHADADYQDDDQPDDFDDDGDFGGDPGDDGGGFSGDGGGDY